MTCVEGYVCNVSKNIKVFNSEKLKDRSKYINVGQNLSFQMNFNKLIVSVLSFHNGYKIPAPHKTKTNV